MAYVDFLTTLHKSTPRDYLARVNAHDKAACAEKALRWDYDYWDGERHFGYGGYRYDGRWRVMAEALVRHYKLKDGAKILDIGCGKGFLLYDFLQVLPTAQVVGIDVSDYAIANAKEEVKPFLRVGNAAKLPFKDYEFDLVVEAYRNEREKVNLMYWQLTCRAFHTPDEWDWVFEQTGYRGDHSFIYFE